MPQTARTWKPDQILDLAVRLRWELMHNIITNKQIMDQCRLTDRLKNRETCASNFSRWLQHAEEEDKAYLLEDDELDRIKCWIDHDLGSIHNPDLAVRLLPTYLPRAFQHWLALSHRTPNFGADYIMYRASAVALGRIVIGRLHISEEPGGVVKTTEDYVITGCGPKDGRYHAEGFITQSHEGDSYLLSRFNNGDLQLAIFTNQDIQKSGNSENKVIAMAGVVMGTMFKKPYSARIYSEASLVDEVNMSTVPHEEVPLHVQRRLAVTVELPAPNVAYFP